MSWQQGKPIKGKRILMLTPDIIIDRRILIEAETLIDEGYEVYLLAGHSAEVKEVYFIEGRVRIERVPFNGVDQRLKLLNRTNSSIITQLNFLSSEIDKLIEYINSHRFIYKFRVSQFIHLTNRLILEIKNILITFLGKSCNKALILATKLFNYFIELTAYEHLFYVSGYRYRPDILHVHDLPMLKVGAYLKKTLKIPLVYDMHEFYPEQPRIDKKTQNSLRKLEKKYIEFADYPLTVNSMLAEVIRKRYGLTKVDVIQNAIPGRNKLFSHFDKTAKYDLFRQEYTWLQGKRLLLYQGWIAPERNLEVSIQGMAHIKSSKWVLLIMGYGDYSEKLKKLAEQYRVTDRICFVPSKSQDILLQYTASADIGLIPYPNDKDINTRLVSPNKLYEFICARLPILTNELPYVEHVVTSSNFGFVTDLNAPQKFAESIDNINMETLCTIRKNLDEFGYLYLWEEEKKKLISLYEKIS